MWSNFDWLMPIDQPFSVAPQPATVAIVVGNVLSGVGIQMG